MTPYLPYPRPSWNVDEVVVWGAWGDMLAACGNILAFGLEDRPLVYWGFDPAIADFIRAQGWPGTVRHEMPLSKGGYYGLIAQATQVSHENGWRQTLGVGLSAWCSLAYTEPREVDVNRWVPKLPVHALEWAQRYLETVTGEAWLLHPRSDHSCPWKFHWKHWVRCVQWMQREFPTASLILTGKDYHWHEKHPRLRNEVGRTPSMLEIFALAELMPGRTITTSNGLSMWCRARSVPCIVASNAAFEDEHNYFRRWVEGEPVTTLHWEDPMPKMTETIYEHRNHYQNHRTLLPA